MKLAVAAGCLLGSLPGVHGRKLGKSAKAGNGLAGAVAVNDNFLANLDSGCTYEFDVLGNDVIDATIFSSVTVDITVPPLGGNVTVLADQNITYTRPGGCLGLLDDDVDIDTLQYRLCDTSSGACGNVATVIFAAYDPYCGTSVGFDDRLLFELLEGDELHRHLSKHETTNENKLAHCLDPNSLYFGQVAMHSECLHPDNMVSNSEAFHYEAEPWAVPKSEQATLLASDPGIWTIESFVSEEEADKLLKLMKKNGDEGGLFGPCRHESQALNANQAERKMCFKISSENACEGPYYVSKCDAPVDPEDAAFIDALRDRFSSMWSADVEALPYIKFQHSLGDTPPMGLHLDAREAISFVLYLSDGGASTLFPFANDGLSVVPKKGSAVAWLNLHSNGSINPKSYHAVQAHPESAGERSIVLFQVETKSFMDMMYA